MVSVAKAWSRRPLASGLELGASGSAVQPLDLGIQGQGLPELEEFLCLFVISAQVEQEDPRQLSGTQDSGCFPRASTLLSMTTQGLPRGPLPAMA
jgi:hypothetical protein